MDYALKLSHLLGSSSVLDLPLGRLNSNTGTINIRGKRSWPIQCEPLIETSLSIFESPGMYPDDDDEAVKCCRVTI